MEYYVRECHNYYVHKLLSRWGLFVGAYVILYLHILEYNESI